MFNPPAARISPYSNSTFSPINYQRGIVRLDLKQIFYTLVGCLSVTLMVLTLQRLLSGWWRRYILLTALIVLNILSAVPTLLPLIGVNPWNSTSTKLYWGLTAIYQISLFMFVLLMTYRAGVESNRSTSVVRLLTIGGFLIGVATVTIHWDPRALSRFLTHVTRDLTFAAAAMNMVLWSFLLKMPKRDVLLMTVCAGLGIQCAGDTLGHSARLLGKQSIHDVGDMIMSVTSLLTMLIWHQAFSRAKYVPAADPSPKPKNGPGAGAPISQFEAR